NMNEKTSITLFGLTGHGKSSIANMLIKVYDTVGVGEPSTGTVPYKEAVKKIRNYFSKCETSLNYIAFVKKKGRFTEEDRKMFNLFKEIFEGSENNFIIIITHSGQKWVDENKGKLNPPEDDDYNPCELSGHVKSSIANMLIHGDICHKGSAFLVHNSPYGASYTLNFNENDDFMAYDTIG
ncbi:11997_t:CDS:2, partial [Funneliformis geosporum]